MSPGPSGSQKTLYTSEYIELSSVLGFQVVGVARVCVYQWITHCNAENNIWSQVQYSYGNNIIDCLP